MPSNAFATHLTQLLEDAEELNDTHTILSATALPPQQKLDALNRTVVVMAVSAWETYVEELAREAVRAMQPPAIPFGSWSVHYASIVGQANRFHTPNPENVKALLSDAVGLADVRQAWTWPGQTTAQAINELDRRCGCVTKSLTELIPAQWLPTSIPASCLTSFANWLRRRTRQSEIIW